MKKLVVDTVKCMGCGACVGCDSEHFDFDDSGLCEVISQENIECESVAQAIDGCPTGAIDIKEEAEVVQMPQEEEIQEAA